MASTRRIFLRNGAMAAIGTAALPSFLTRAALAATSASPSTLAGKRLVVIFQRGAADGLNIVVPHGEAAYYSLRPTLAIPKKDVLDLDGMFGLHPALASLKPLWDEKRLAIVHAAGSPDPTRSHFDAQDYMESGTPGVKNTADGWLNRALNASESARGTSDVFRGVALGTAMPRMLSGTAPAVAVGNLSDFGVAPRSPQAQPLTETFEAMYASSVDAVLHGTAQETFDAVKMLRAADPAKYKPAPGANYPKGRFGDAMRQMAQLMKANLGVQVAFTDINGWDHHVNEGASEGQLANLLREFGGALAAFYADLGPLAQDTVIVTMSEFGRTARENGTRGTDHGHANAIFVLGGNVRGGKVYGRWPGLADEQLYEHRDLALTTDFRQVLSEAVQRQLNPEHPAAIFPGFRDPGHLHLLG
ncbi:MAG: DUF1501 domain-containing protein [Acidobacteriota bacterium]|nr:DUF1501 domain-containing protein [Acidobacteriota bacterium]